MTTDLSSQPPAAAGDAEMQRELVAMQQRAGAATGYLRDKINQLLQVMGTLPLEPEELDDETLFSLDPLGIISDAFAQVLEHLNRTNEELALARDEIRAIFDAVGAAILVVDGQGRIQAHNRCAQELFFSERADAAGCFCHDVVCRQPQRPANCQLRAILEEARSAAAGETIIAERCFLVTANSLRDPQGGAGQVALVYTDVTQRRQMEQALRETKKRLKTIVQSVQAGILVIDAEEHRIVDANDKALELIGASRAEVLGFSCHNFICSAMAGECPITDLGQSVDAAERWLLNRRGEQIPVLKTVTAIELDGRRHLLESFIDLSRRKQAERALQESEHRYRSLYAHMREGVSLNALILGGAGEPRDYRVLDANPAFARLLGCPVEELVGRLASAIFAPAAPPHLRVYATVVDSGQATSFESHCTTLDRDFHISVFSPAAGQFAIVLEDITERKRAEREMERLAYFDVLTGLPNRSLFRDRLEQALGMAGRLQQQVALMFIDLDQFKEVNDTLGHATGDHLLTLVAERLAGCTRKSDTVARLGGDEFVMILCDIGGEQNATALGHKVLETLAAPIRVAQREIFITGSLGIALYPHDGLDAETLIKNADAAMYQAKAQGNTCQFYTSAMNSLALERLLLGNDLRRALERNEFFLEYQPQISVAGNRIIGFEALLRWRHPDLGLLPPSQFIPLAEETGLILPIGRWVLETACTQAVAWQDAGFPAMTVAVNLSGRQFREADLPQLLAAILDRTGLAAAQLELEITETILMENADATRQTLEVLKKMGLQLAIDDFGTGYSSLSYLKHFPIDRLKIDRSFVHDITTDADDAAIVEAIIALAHTLDLTVVAEGVETEAQYAFLRSRGCDEMQGFHFCHPVSAEALEARLAAGWTDLPG